MMGFDTGALLPLDKALQGMLEQLTCCCETEQLPLPQALDRILAEEISSPLSVPPFDNAAMDGYAVRLAISPPAPRSPWRARPSPASPMRANGRPVTASAS
jgi:molybdopterin biosynthesis enzyme